MKVTLMSLNYLPSTGGLVSYIRNLIEYLKIDGSITEIRIITTDGKRSELEECVEIDGVTIKRIRAYKFSKFLTPIAPYMAVKNIISELKKMDFHEDEIIIIRHLYFAYAASKVIKHNNKKIYVVPLVAPRLQLMNLSQVGILKKIYYLIIIPQLYKIEKFAIQNINNVAVLSESKGKEIAEYYNYSLKKIGVVYPGINIDKFRPIINLDEKEKLIKNLELSIRIDQKIIITVCRIVSEKNIEYLLSALKNIKYNDYKLLIVGDGPLKEELVSYSKKICVDDKVIFLGFRNDVELLYRISDVFVLPSKYEGFGHVYLEALASGLPCIGLKNNPPKFITATEEIIIEKVNGYIVNGDDTNSLTEVLDELLSNESLLLNLKSNAREDVVKRFTWKSHFEKIQKIVAKGDTNE